MHHMFIMSLKIKRYHRTLTNIIKQNLPTTQQIIKNQKKKNIKIKPLEQNNKNPKTLKNKKILDHLLQLHVILKKGLVLKSCPSILITQFHLFTHQISISQKGLQEKQ
ncbi:hypothetical protein Hanom_Chr09g00777841 [Helianthus anomalus]